MGRKLRRVQLDFQWPLNQVWQGYVNPHIRPCPEDGRTCFGGSTAAAKWLDAVAQLLALLGSDAAEAQRREPPRGVFPHPWLREWNLAPKRPLARQVQDRIDALPNRVQRNRAYAAEDARAELLPLTPELLDVLERFSGKPVETAFRGASNHYNMRRAFLKFAGVDGEWGICSTCGGDAIDPAIREAYEKWEPSDPPQGEGWQLWETVSEGSPISPVFPSARELAHWCASQDPAFVGGKGSAEDWCAWLDARDAGDRSWLSFIAVKNVS
jgi:hypothetical protein